MAGGLPGTDPLLEGHVRSAADTGLPLPLEDELDDWNPDWCRAAGFSSTL